MPVPSAITDLSQTPGSNSPAGSESPALLDDYTRTVFSFIAKLRDGQGLSAPVDLASAATTDIGGATSPIVRITGTTTITSFGANYNGPRFLTFAGALTLTHNATTLILPGGANITTAAGDRAIFVPKGNPADGWNCVAYQIAALAPGVSNSTNTVADGAITTNKIVDANVTFAKFQNVSTMTMPGRTAVGSGPLRELSVAEVMGNFVTSASDTAPGKIEIAVQSEMETATSLSLAVTPGRQQYHPSAAKGWVYALTDGTGNGSYNVTSLGDAGTGSVVVNWATAFSTANYIAFVGTYASTTQTSARVSAMSAGSLTTRCYASGSDVDPIATFVVAFGDL